MRSPRLLLATLAAIALTLAVALPAAAHDDGGGRGGFSSFLPPTDIAVGNFYSRSVVGASVFTAVPNQQVLVYGTYRNLTPGQSYFTVIYGNKVCDPAQAFPVGPFTADANGRGVLFSLVPLPAVVDVGLTGSVSVRFADADAAGNPTDVDNDGLTGTTDVIAVAGQPSIGLVRCDTRPFVVNR